MYTGSIAMALNAEYGEVSLGWKRADGQQLQRTQTSTPHPRSEWRNVADVADARAM
jgi:hypothetical protein